jgi:SNF family Na+-dependent transporter
VEDIKVNTALAIVLIAFAIVILAGLVVIPALQEVQAANSISEDRNKGKGER